MASIETVAADGFAMDYFRFGQGDDVLVVLPGLSVQSVMGLASAVEDAYRILADDFTVYVFDRRKDLPATYSMQEMARDTEAALEALGLERACIFGASQGGMLAMRIAIERPELVGKLILGSTAARVTEGQFQHIEQWIAFAREGRAEDLYLAFGELVYPQDVFEQSHGVLAEAAKTVTEEDLSRFAILAESIRGFDVTKDLGMIDCPVLVIGDRDDRLLGADASEQIAELLDGKPGFELYLYDGYGHAAYDTAPDYKERMLQFLTAEEL